MSDTATRWKIVIAAVVILLLGGIITAIVIVRSEPDEEEVLVEEVIPCTDDTIGSNEWCCDGVTHPLIIDDIDGTISVKLYEKHFDEREIEELKKVHSFHERSTYEIFEEIAEKTKRCEYTMDTFEMTDPYFKTSTFTG